MSHHHDKAIAALTKVGAPTADPTALTAWAQQWDTADREHQPTPDGLIIGESGTVHADTRRSGTGTYIWAPRPKHPLHQVHGREVSMCLGTIREIVGERVLPLSHGELGLRHRPDHEMRHLIGLAAQVNDTTAQIDHAKTLRDEAVRELYHGTNAPAVADLSAAAGVNRAQVHSITRTAPGGLWSSGVTLDNLATWGGEVTRLTASLAEQRAARDHAIWAMSESRPTTVIRKALTRMVSPRTVDRAIAAGRKSAQDGTTESPSQCG